MSVCFLVFVVLIGARFQVVEGRYDVLLPDHLGLIRIVIRFLIIILVFAFSDRRRQR